MNQNQELNNTKMTPEEKLFKLVFNVGEWLEGDVHIIDTTIRPTEADELSFRVYHKEGYCWDIKKEIYFEDDEDNIIEYHYTFYEEWDGFKKVSSIEEAISKLLVAVQVSGIY